MSWLANLSWSEAAGLLCTAFMVVIALASVKPRRRNRRVGLPAPRHDERNSIEQFRRMNQS